MADAVRSKGGVIRLSTPVRELVVEGGQCRGVILEDGERIEADCTVLNADFSHAMKHLVPARHRRTYTDAKLERMRYSCSTFMLYLGLDTVYEGLEHHSIVFADDYRRNIEEISGSLRLSEDFSFYVQNASRTDPTLAPKGGSTLYMLVPVPNNESGIDWDAIKQEFRDRVIAAAETRGGFEGLSRHIVEEEIVTPLDWERKHDVYKGATFNLSHDIGQMLYLRPHNEFEEFGNCYLVGGGTHPGSGLPTIYESGRISAELIMKRFG
jgi:phytoene desaturase